jgi:hypothetical protein
MFSGDHKKVQGSNRCNVLDGHHQVILIDQSGGNFLSDDSAEKTIIHRFLLL